MNESRSLAPRLMALAGIIIVMAFAFSDTSETFRGYLDLRAALLVFVTPILVSILFQREKLHWREAYRRIREIKTTGSQKLLAELQEAVQGGENHRVSKMMSYMDGNEDSFVRYGGELFTSRFNPEELSNLLAQRIEAEDAHWQGLAGFFAFLSKMAPYFGMLATVVGMVKLLQNLNDYTKISGGMALAMQGTLYGLISFTMVYSPLQRFFNGYRDLVSKRNEMIAKWLIRVSEKADPHYIREELKSMNFSPTSRSAEPAPAQRPGSTSPLPVEGAT